VIQFQVGDKAVYPAQGVGEIIGIDEKSVSGGCFEGDAMEIELKPVVELGATPPEERYLVRATDGRMTVFTDGTVQFSAELHREVSVRLRCDRLHTFPALEAG
jgi:xanthine/CO dehydrogenase XdhC/CoxF family maturation factor